MPEHIYEDSEYTVTATLKTGGYFSGAYKGKLDLYYCKNGNEGAPLKKESDIDVNNGEVVRKYKVPLVEGTEDNYKFTIVAKYGPAKETTRVLADAVVWPKAMKAKFELKKSTGNEALGLAPFTLKYSDFFTTNTKAATDFQGNANENLKKDLYTIEMPAPYEKLSDTAATKRDHVVVVRKNGKARFYSPDITTEPYVVATEGGTDKKAGVRQYVNLDSKAPNTDGSDARGSIVTFAVGNIVEAEGLTGDEIFVKVEFSKISKRDAPAPELLAAGVTNVKNSGGGKVWTGKVTLTADGGKPTFKVQFPLAGGETVKVSAGYTEGDPTDDVLTFVTWRKLMYRVRYPDMMQTRLVSKTRPVSEGGGNYYDLPASLATKVKERLAPLFVEYYNVHSESFTAAVGGAALVPGNFIDASGLGATEIYVLDGNKNWAVGAPAFDLTSADLTREVHMTLCDQSYSSRVKTVDPEIELTVADKTERISTEYQYHFFKKTPKAADQDNLILAGKEWTAKLDAVPANQQKKKPTVNAAAATGVAPPLSYTISEATTGEAPITVTLAPDKSLPATEKSKIESYFNTCLTKVDKIRAASNTLAFTYTGSSGAEGDDVRAANVASAISSIATASTVEIPIHPGLADDGTPRKGAMTQITVTQPNTRNIRFQLPAGTDEPGSFVGPPGPQKCPVIVRFTIDGTYSINGNAGSGEQLMCLRDTLPGPCSSTVCHELGHSMGMTLMPASVPCPPGLTRPNHVDASGTYYINGNAPFNNGVRNRHAGGHCCFGMPSSNRPNATFNDWGAGASDATCIMWGEGGTEDNRTSFCPTCRDVVRARRLEDIRSSWYSRVNG